MTREQALWMLLVASVTLMWYSSLPKTAPVGQYTAATPAPELKRIPTVDITPKKVKVYAPKAKSALNLPAEQQANGSLHVLSAAKLPASERPRTVVSTLDESTGQSAMIVRYDPLPWLAAESRGQIWVGVGVKNGLERVGRVEARYDVLQVKALHFGARATVDTDSAWFAGVGVAHHFD